MVDYKNPMFKRNYGFYSEAEQQKIIESKVSIAGVGGDGFQLGEKMARMGVMNFVVADPEEFELENENRVTGARHSTIGRNKAEVFRDTILDIQPEANVKVYTEGVTMNNVDEFVGDSDLILDESELTHLELGTMIAREARRRKIPVLTVMNIGFAAVATSFSPYGGKTFEEMVGVPKGMPIDEVKDLKVDFSKYLPYIPKYGDIRSLIAAEEGAPLPSITQGVDTASALGSTEAFLHLTKGVENHRRQPTWAPSWRYMDAYSGESGVTSTPRLSHYLGLIALLSRSGLHLNPLASYSKDDRKRREM